jgi:hypothetical protein
MKADVLYQNGACWIVQNGKTYEVCILEGTCGRVMDRIGISYPDALNYAKKCCDRREENRVKFAALQKGIVR